MPVVCPVYYADLVDLPRYIPVDSATRAQRIEAQDLFRSYLERQTRDCERQITDHDLERRFNPENGRMQYRTNYRTRSRVYGDAISMARALTSVGTRTFSPFGPAGTEVHYPETYDTEAFAHEGIRTPAGLPSPNSSWLDTDNPLSAWNDDSLSASNAVQTIVNRTTRGLHCISEIYAHAPHLSFNNIFNDHLGPLMNYNYEFHGLTSELGVASLSDFVGRLYLMHILLNLCYFIRSTYNNVSRLYRDVYHGH
jgi:hypothetical protein